MHLLSINGLFSVLTLQQDSSLGSFEGEEDSLTELQGQNNKKTSQQQRPPKSKKQVRI